MKKQSMKTTLLILSILPNFLLAGCRDQAADKRIADLQKRVDQLEAAFSNSLASNVFRFARF
jgi:hypothetical protein